MPNPKPYWETASPTFGLAPNPFLPTPLINIVSIASLQTSKPPLLSLRIKKYSELRELDYSWELGVESNNIAEALSLWQGLIQARKLEIKEITVIGDSWILIQDMVTNTFPTQMNLCHILKKIMWLSCSFQKIDFFHVLHHLNAKADQVAKAATHLSRGQLSLNGTLVFVPLP
jgi:ribonuclease HI